MDAALKLSIDVLLQIEIYIIYHTCSSILHCSTEKIHFKTCAILQCAFDAIIEKCVNKNECIKKSI